MDFSACQQNCIAVFTLNKTSSSILYFLHLVLKILRHVIGKSVCIIQLTKNQTFGKALSHVKCSKSLELSQVIKR